MGHSICLFLSYSRYNTDQKILNRHLWEEAIVVPQLLHNLKGKKKDWFNSQIAYLKVQVGIKKANSKREGRKNTEPLQSQREFCLDFTAIKISALNTQGSFIQPLNLFHVMQYHNICTYFTMC